MIIEDPIYWRNCQEGKYLTEISNYVSFCSYILLNYCYCCCRILLNYRHQQILYILRFDFCMLCCWYCKDHIDWLHDDHICFDLKPQILQLHNWIELVLSILRLSTVKQPCDLQSGQQYDGTFVSWSTPNWTILL